MFCDNNKVLIAVTTAAGASATSAITSAAIDTNGFGGCCFVVDMGPITTGAATSIKIQQSSDDAVADNYEDVLGTNITIADDDDNNVKYLDIHHPSKQYLKLIVSRATQVATVGSVIAILYDAKHRPAVQGANVAGEGSTGPVEGTA